MKETEIIVIGAGPAGISASIESAKRGASVTLIDEKRELGGKVLRQITDGRSVLFANKQEIETARRLFAELKKIGGKLLDRLMLEEDELEVWESKFGEMLKKKK